MTTPREHCRWDPENETGGHLEKKKIPSRFGLHFVRLAPDSSLQEKNQREGAL